MKQLADGDRILPDGFHADDFELRFDGNSVTLEMRSDDGQAVTLEASWVLSFRHDLAEDEDSVEGSVNILRVLQVPAWDLPYRDEEGSRGDFAREKNFYHLHIPDVGILECWAVAVARR